MFFHIKSLFYYVSYIFKCSSILICTHVILDGEYKSCNHVYMHEYSLVKEPCPFLTHRHVFLHGLHLTICLSLDSYVSHGHVSPVTRPCVLKHMETIFLVWNGWKCACVLEHMAFWLGTHGHVTHRNPDSNRLLGANHVRTHF